MSYHQQHHLVANKKANFHMHAALDLLSSQLHQFEILGLDYSLYPRLLRATQALKRANNQYENDAYFVDIKEVAKDIDHLDGLGLLPFLHCLKIAKTEVKQIYQLSACIDRDFKSLRAAIKRLKSCLHRVESKHDEHWQNWCQMYVGAPQWSIFAEMIASILETMREVDTQLDDILKGLERRTMGGQEMCRAIVDIESAYHHILHLSGADPMHIDQYSYFRKYYSHIKQYYQYKQSLLATHPFRMSASLLMKQGVFLLLAIMLWFHHSLISVSDGYFIMMLMGVAGSDLIRTAFTGKDSLGFQSGSLNKNLWRRAIAYLDFVQALGIFVVAISYAAAHSWSPIFLASLLGIAGLGFLFLIYLVIGYFPEYRQACRKVRKDLAFLHQYTSTTKFRSMPLKKKEIMVKAMRDRLQLLQCGHSDYFKWCLNHIDLSSYAFRVA